MGPRAKRTVGRNRRARAPRCQTAIGCSFHPILPLIESDWPDTESAGKPRLMMPTNQSPRDRLATETAGTQGVELKVTVSEDKEDAAAQAFGLDPASGERRRIFFFDTPDLALFKHGVVLRARDVKGGKDDSTVKIRPVDPEKLADEWRQMKGFKIEADGVGNQLIRSASLSVEQGDNEIRAVESGVRAIEKLFSPDQERLLADMSPVRVNFGAVQLLGPGHALRWDVTHEGLPYRITAEEWTLDDGQDLLEVSIKVPTAQASAASAAFDAFLRGLHLKPQGGQETKTRIALEFFVKQLRV